MSAVGEIEEAIAKLTQLRDAATPGPWWSWHSGHGRMGSSVDAATHDPDNPEMVVEGMAADVDLIVAVLGTIDAQLFILNNAVSLRLVYYPNNGAGLAAWESSNEVAVRLARAINGTV